MSYQAQSAVVGTIQTSPIQAQSAPNQNAAYDFYWNQDSATPNYGGFGQAMELRDGAAVSGNVLSISSTTFSESRIFNNTNSNQWASTQRGYMEMEFRYSAYVGNAVFLFLDGKSIANAAVNTNDGAQFRSIVPVASPAVFMRYVGNDGGTTVNSPNLTWNGSATNTWFLMRGQYNRAAARTLQIQVGTEPGVYSATALPAPRAFVWHQILAGNDTANSFAHDQRNHYIYPTWTYDMCSTVWQDFEFTTVDQASLEANDHNSAITWSLAGTTSRFTTDAAGAFTMPCQINFQGPTASTKGLRNDLNATAAGSIGFTGANATTDNVFGFWVKTANLANGTSARIAFATETSPSNTILAVEQSDSGGQEQLYIRNHAGTSSSVINVSADTWYWCSVKAIRNNTCRLQVFDTTGVQVGSEVTVTGTNASIGNIRIGSLNTTTSQSAGVYHYISGFCYDAQSLVYPFKPWQ